MPDVPKQQRTDLLDKAVAAAAVGVDAIEALSNSPNPDVAADATEQLIAARNSRDDVADIRAFLATVPAGGLKPISAEDLAMLGRLENAIDARIQANQLIEGGLTAAGQVIGEAQSIGQILSEGKVKAA